MRPERRRAADPVAIADAARARLLRETQTQAVDLEQLAGVTVREQVMVQRKSRKAEQRVRQLVSMRFTEAEVAMKRAAADLEQAQLQREMAARAEGRRK